MGCDGIASYFNVQGIYARHNAQQNIAEIFSNF